jgi:hypothetical protein
MIVERTAAEQSLKALLIEHVRRLACWEHIFGPATALSSFGRLYASIANRPRWLLSGTPAAGLTLDQPD